MERSSIGDLFLGSKKAISNEAISDQLSKFCLPFVRGGQEG
jgi:hypothetical protein